MRVRRGRVVDISKTMEPEDADGENLGIVKFGPQGARLLVEKMDALVAAGERKAWVPRAFKAFADERPLHVDRDARPALDRNRLSRRLPPRR